MAEKGEAPPSSAGNEVKEEAARLRSEYGLADGGGDMAEMMQLLLGSLGAGAAPAELGLSGAPAVLFQLLAQAHQADDDDDDASELA